MERAYDLGRILVLRRNSEARVPSVRPAGAASPPRSRSSLQADPRLCLCTRGRHTRPRARSERMAMQMSGVIRKQRTAMRSTSARSTSTGSVAEQPQKEATAALGARASFATQSFTDCGDE